MAHEQPRRPGRPPAGGEDKRERILTEAISLFARSGFAATSLADVAQAAQISKAGLLHHFGSKASLYSAVLERRDARDAGALTSASDVWQQLDAFADLMDRNAETPAMVGLYMAMAVEGTRSGHPAHRWLTDHFTRAVDAFTAGFERGKINGAVHPDAPSRGLARSVVALADGIQLQWLTVTSPDQEPVRMGDQIRQLTELIRSRWAT
ncbi:TetR/AcrR family transcriptional regulator [Ruania rhizosphaerae]|uniref:TetR/AcrR family transcriptional regulator n=1 Tax=Ruania rhizosphaerae TaxID=1840413 RepID=UPI00135B4B07|nr:TetR/AcrR family transcriptional regulator [Ruania rhizosphaerae]